MIAAAVGVLQVDQTHAFQVVPAVKCMLCKMDVSGHSKADDGRPAWEAVVARLFHDPVRDALFDHLAKMFRICIACAKIGASY